MRKIEFRIWDTQDNEFLDASIASTVFAIICSDSGKGKSFGCCPDNYRDGRYVPQQYTDYEDKNFKKIFEGDILKIPLKEINGTSYHYFQVKWDDFYHGWALADKAGQGLNHTGWKFYNVDRGEVVGNIFENIKLLEK